MPRQSGLGRGLDALIAANETQAEGNLLYVPVEKIVPNPRQPRGAIDPSALQELSASIREHGVLQPLIVSHDSASDRYVLVAGERRWRAAQLAGLKSVPVILYQSDEQERLELALIENVQRADLTPLEMAHAFQELAEEFGLSHEEIAARVGKSRAAVTNTLRLLKLPQAVLVALSAGEISEGHARALLALPDAASQEVALELIRRQGLSVRQTEELVHKLSAEQARPQAKKASADLADPEIRSLEQRLRDKLGTKVTLRATPKGGSLTLFYYSEEELEQLLALLLGDD